MTDTHPAAHRPPPLRRPRRSCLFGIPTRELLQDVLAHVEASGLRPDHVVVTGDHTHDELPQRVRGRAGGLLAALARPPLAAPRQPRRPRRAPLRLRRADRRRGRRAHQLLLQAGGWLCLGLDTQVPGRGGRAARGRARSNGCARQLDEHAARAAVLFMHHPPVELGLAVARPHRDRGQGAAARAPRRRARIRLVCCGHVHHESSHRVGAAEVVTTPSTGLQFSPVSDEAEFVSAPPGYRLDRARRATATRRRSCACPKPGTPPPDAGGDG